MTDPSDEYFDHRYWGEEGPQPAKKWGAECQRGAHYKQTGAPVAGGTPGVRRQLGGARKARGVASDNVESE